jgi:hypothetical protein
MTKPYRSHQASLQTVYKKLDRDEPFTSNEESAYSKKELAIIRGIQLKDKLSKDDAKEKYITYLNKSKKAVKSLSTGVRKYLKAQYPKTGGGIEHNVDEFERIPQKSKIRNNNKKEVENFISNEKNKQNNPKTYNRVKSGHEKYKNASVGELRHGVNSQWSQDWRLSHGLQRNYK